ncbi:ADP-ribosylation factor-like protein 3 [Actinia tenebrosa]|uniref:ADP-ribosylation factor-like protein 3 n=1 Tax=Actinia tenebrosa TaxID=6105 RepID=A0A6P8IR22_ACTTE|nr:ADP-ribosylation factor-like protein 3 [Actinia tenebrosa]
MGLSNWFKDLGMAGKAAVVVASGVALTASAYGIYSLYNSTTEPKVTKSDESDEEESIPEKRILVLGLDDAGKSVFLAALAQPDSTTRASTQPTEGFNVVCLTTDGLNLNIWEIGGSQKYRDYWPNFIEDCSLLVYIVDASNPSRFEESNKVLHGLLSEPKLYGVPVLLVTSKNDLSQARSLTEVTSVVQLQEVTKKSGSKWSTVSVQVNSNGETDGFIEAKAKILGLCK